MLSLLLTLCFNIQTDVSASHTIEMSEDEDIVYADAAEVDIRVLESGEGKHYNVYSTILNSLYFFFFLFRMYTRKFARK